jgi:hypothetical protein
LRFHKAKSYGSYGSGSGSTTLANILFNRYSKHYGAAGKLKTHGSQHFHKQNALKAVAFLSTAESPQLRVDTHILVSQNLAKQKEGNRKLVK